MIYMLSLILGVAALFLSVLLFKQAAVYNSQAEGRKDDEALSSQLYKSGTDLRLYAIGLIIAGVVLVGYYVKMVVL